MRSDKRESESEEESSLPLPANCDRLFRALTECHRRSGTDSFQQRVAVSAPEPRAGGVRCDGVVRRRGGGRAESLLQCRHLAEEISVSTSSDRVIHLPLCSSAIKIFVPHVYCIGDANGKLMLAHAASAQGISVVEQLTGRDHVLNHLNIPAACFTHPEISMVGLTEVNIGVSVNEPVAV